LVFSLFGKKPPEKKPVEKKPARPAAKPGTPAPAAPPPSELPDDAPDLDFTNYLPTPTSAEAPPAAPPRMESAPAPALKPKAQPAPAPGPMPALDFGDLPAVAPSQESGKAEPAREETAPETTRAAPAPHVPAAEPPKPPRKSKKDVDSIMCIEVEDGAAEMPGVIEEGAILFANGQADQALARLEAALAGESLGAWQLQTWLMLFDLYQHLGQKARFEERALDFVVKFERSPPVWTDAPKADKAPSALRTGGAAHVSLSGTLSAASANALEQLRKMAERQPKLRVDFTKLQGVDADGCRLLLDALKALKKAKKEVYFSGEAQGLKLLRELAKPGDPSTDQAVWQLLLELYQQLGLQNEFEEAAVDFAVTYELSPPSWEAPPPKAKAAPPPVEPEPAAAPEDAFYFEGEVAGANDALFNELTDYAQAANPIVIDMSRTRRIDFVNAGRLLNTLEKLASAERSIVIRGVGEMVAALLSVMRITKLARVIPRK
jgi:anti-anti-sigma regulatory factor